MIFSSLMVIEDKNVLNWILNNTGMFSLKVVKKILLFCYGKCEMGKFDLVG